MRVLKAVGRFWYDFVIGDDPKIAGLVLASLAVGVVLLLVGVSPAPLTVICGVLVLVGFAGALVVEARLNRG